MKDAQNREMCSICNIFKICCVQKEWQAEPLELCYNNIETEGNAFFLTDILGVVINIDDVTQITTRATNRQVCDMIAISFVIL